MRYTYEIYDRMSGDRIEICTKFEEVSKYIPETVIVKIFDNAELSTTPVNVLETSNDFAEWADKIGRDSSWKPTRFSGHGSVEEGKDERNPCVDVAISLESANKAHAKFINTFLPDSNKKTLAAVGKPQFSGIPPIAMMALGEAMQDGVNKYGLFNWRDSAVTSTVFYDAIIRHLLAWYSGERNARDSNIHHLAHAMAGCAILLDAEYNDKLNDDRKKGFAVTQEVVQGFIKKT